VTATLAVRDLRTTFSTDAGRFAAVDGATFEVERGRTLALVGESGCGKSVTALSIMGLVPPPGRIEGGSSVRFEGTELVGLAPRALRDLRGNAMAMIFQEPMSSLNPAWTIGEQIVEGLRRHRRIGAAAAERRAVEALERVRIPAPAERFHAYPHQLSGGMRQRAMIAMALACEPRLLIADEPTTALDVTVQAQILELLKTLQRETGMAMVLITHDLGVVAEVADDVAVMYAGRIVERARVAELFGTPQHPYTVGLRGSVPRLDVERTRLVAIDGQVPSLLAAPRGCRFAPRCPFADAACRAADPPLRAVDGEHPGEAVGARDGPHRNGDTLHAAACRKAPLDPERLARERLAALEVAA
jgi:peptide/nickel transport system ATP-binding protein